MEGAEDVQGVLRIRCIAPLSADEPGCQWGDDPGGILRIPPYGRRAGHCGLSLERKKGSFTPEAYPWVNEPDCVNVLIINCLRGYALAVCCRVSSACCGGGWKRTDTSFETPGSCMVTP